MTYLSVKNAVTTFRSTISFSGSCFSPSEGLDPISERCNFQHTPHTLPRNIHKHKNNLFSLKISSLVYQIRLFWHVGHKTTGIKYGNSKLCKAIQVHAKFMSFFSMETQESLSSVSLLRGETEYHFFFFFFKGQNKSLAKKNKNKVVFSAESYDSFAFPSLNKYINKPQGKVLPTSQLKQKQQLWHRAGWESTPQYTWSRFSFAL